MTRTCPVSISATVGLRATTDLDLLSAVHALEDPDDPASLNDGADEPEVPQPADGVSETLPIFLGSDTEEKLQKPFGGK